jgi:putative endonuclease
MAGWVYILSNRPNGTLYVGVTGDLICRVWQHKTHVVASFTARYDLHRLVYFEEFATLPDAIQREKNIKHWPRAWKVRLIHAVNPDWDDLYESLI